MAITYTCDICGKEIKVQEPLMGFVKPTEDELKQGIKRVIGDLVGRESITVRVSCMRIEPDVKTMDICPKCIIEALEMTILKDKCLEEKSSEK